MVWPNLQRERSLWRQGWKIVVGIDEVGRGALAGPVVAAAVVFDDQTKKMIPGVRDSKQLSANSREKLARLIKKVAMFWTVAVVPEEVIDQLGIGVATYTAMYQAFKIMSLSGYCLIDGNIYPKVFTENKVLGIALVRGDQSIYSISAASLIAKTTRDQIMKKLDRDYPKYRWGHNKGYGTETHYQAIRKLGPSPRHRQSFTLT